MADRYRLVIGVGVLHGGHRERNRRVPVARGEGQRPRRHRHRRRVAAQCRKRHVAGRRTVQYDRVDPGLAFGQRQRLRRHRHPGRYDAVVVVDRYRGAAVRDGHRVAIAGLHGHRHRTRRLGHVVVDGGDGPGRLGLASLNRHRVRPQRRRVSEVPGLRDGQGHREVLGRSSQRAYREQSRRAFRHRTRYRLHGDDGDRQFFHVRQFDGHGDGVTAPGAVGHGDRHLIGRLRLEVVRHARLRHDLAGRRADDERCRVGAAEAVGQCVAVRVRRRDRGADVHARSRVFLQFARRGGAFVEDRGGVRLVVVDHRHLHAVDRQAVVAAARCRVADRYRLVIEVVVLHGGHGERRRRIPVARGEGQ